MVEHAEQLVGTLFRTLAEEGYTEAQTALLDAYQSEAETDREELAENLFSEVVSILDSHLEAEREVDVLVTAVERLLDRFSAVIEAAPVAILVVDADWSIELWNGGAERIFGWGDAEIRQRSYPEVLPESPDGIREHLDHLREGEQLTGVETRHSHEDGSVLDVRIWASPFHTQEGTFNGATFVISDISEQKRREQRLAVLNRVLRHNIRNDVTVVQGHLDMLVEDVEGGSEHARVMNDHLSSIVELSEAARHIEQLRGKSEGELTTIDLGRVVRERVERLQREFQNAEFHLVGPESVSVVAHELLPYALDNVLDNAIEHNDSDEPLISVVVSTDETRARERTTISIADNGPGIPEMERAVLTSETETPLNHSNGIGLWLTRWIVRSSDGTLAVEESEWGGTRIEIQLPTRADPSTA